LADASSLHDPAATRRRTGPCAARR
jgi:hypothetical protein